ncbi:MAG: hypothetical protein CBC83_07910 [Flavobacteriales bacterium TMED123]|nr:MAG: hypothetical protein CBC83_07910 [Flavobacteriales bacterium TMED123]|tara:strand:+ start:391 stop:576 length:186 start_codon:yes stop_codon:yes gene_type:complete
MDKHNLKDIINDIESEMVKMWSLNEAAHVLEDDESYIQMILTAVFYEIEHFRQMGMIVGEA